MGAGGLVTLAPRLRVIGPGRAGHSLAAALADVGWEVVGFLGRGDDVADALRGTDLLVVATPDQAIREVVAAVRPDDPRVAPGGVIAHLAGSLGLDTLAPHRRVAALHPLVALPTAEIGARRLRAGPWFSVAGHPIVQRAVSDLGGRWFEVADVDRATYHAAAVVASNHLVALLGQVERIAGSIDVPVEAYLDLARATLDNVADLGAAVALTGPAARGDWETVARHLAALQPGEREAYRALAAAARRLVDDQGLPPDL